MGVTVSNITDGEVYKARSPIFMTFTPDTVSDTLKSITLDIKIWNGDQVSDKPGSNTYALSYSSTNIGADRTSFDVNISELAREYIDTDAFNGAYDASWACWVEIDYTATDTTDDVSTGVIEIMCVNGFAEYTDSDNKATSYYIASDKVYVPEGSSYVVSALDISVPGATRTVDEIKITYADGTTSSTSFGTAGTSTVDLFQTATVTLGDNDSATVQYLLSSTEVASFTVEKYCKEKYTVYQVGYVNKNGVMDYIQFFGVNQFTQSANRKTYRPALTSAYTSSTAQNRILYANGSETFSLNTDWVDEDYSARVTELLLTEYAILVNWTRGQDFYQDRVEADGGTFEGLQCVKDGMKALELSYDDTAVITRTIDTRAAVRPTDGSQVIKNKDNELINYTVEFEKAFDTITSIQ